MHEIPFMFPGNQQQLAVGNVITSEPGIYIPNVGGIRIEDVMVVTEQGYEKLTQFPWDLFELV